MRRPVRRHHTNQEMVTKARIKHLFVFAIYTLILISCMYIFFLTQSSLSINARRDQQFLVHQLEKATVPTYKKYFSTWRYTLAVEYREQLTMATLNLFSLAQVGQYWGARAVVPFTLDSYLFGFPASNRRKLDVLFNISELKTTLVSDKYNLPPLADFEEFMKMADRSIVFVHIEWDIRSFGITKEDFGGKIGIDCSHHSRVVKAGRSVVKILNNEAHIMHVKKFSISSYCCINPYTDITTGGIAEICKFTDTNSTLIFDLWRGHGNTSLNNTLKRNFRLVIPGTQTPGRPCDDVFPCSKDIRSNATAFTQSFSHGKEFIAFHFRTTKIGVLGKDYTDACMKIVFALRDNLTKTYPEIPIKYFVDYGEFGATQDGHGKENVIPYIKKDEIIPLHYNPEEFGGLRDNGFVSLVEKIAMANSKILVLVGRGCFQATLAKRMQEEPTSERIHYICRRMHAVNQWSLDIPH